MVMYKRPWWLNLSQDRGCQTFTGLLCGVAAGVPFVSLIPSTPGEIIASDISSPDPLLALCHGALGAHWKAKSSCEFYLSASGYQLAARAILKTQIIPIKCLPKLSGGFHCLLKFGIP